ncbi:Rha family transcriptional regulator [Xanthobacter sediminis]|uniref:Rha family transcriptional regulator n=1 Tax=Xanthobacter sediminis TaxID=3119926 RepID=UPI00372B8D7B
MNAHSAYASSTGGVTLRPIVTHGAAGRPVTNSRDVAAYFGKAHKHVLDAIDALISQAPSIEPNFRPIKTDVKVGFGTRKDRAYLMDRDGFTLLAMGFTGPKALQFKMAYIAEFNAMEAELNAAAEKPAFQLPDFTDPAAAAIAWAEEYREKEAAQTALAAAQESLAIAEPKAEALDAIATADGLFNLGAAAKNLGIPPRAGFITTLVEWGEGSEKSRVFKVMT